MTWAKILRTRTLATRTLATRTLATRTVAGGAVATLAAAASLGLAGCVHLGGPKAPPPPKPVAFCAPIDRIDLIAATSPGRLLLTGGGDAVAMLPACGPPFIGQRITSSDSSRFILLIDDLREEGGAGYTLGFTEAGGEGLTNEASTVGALTLQSGPVAKDQPRRLRFDVTKTMRAMADAAHFEHMIVTVKLDKPVPAGASVSVARLQIVVE